MSEGISAEVLAEAKSDGWAEKEQWRGPPELWVNADEFVRRKHTVLPLLRKANEKVTGELAATREELKALRENMTEFVKYQQEQTLAKLADQRRVLMAQKREAADSGDDAAVVRIEEQLDENAEAKAALKAKPVETVEVKPAPEPADLTMWRAANPWFGTDDVKTGLAMGLAREAAKQGLTGKPYFDHIDKGIKKIYAPEPPADKSEGGGPSGQGAPRSGSGKYSSLPPEAKAQCDADAKRFVGSGKMFKDTAAWQSHFCKLYFEE